MLSSCFNKINDLRKKSKLLYSLHDALMSGFACVYFQDPSLLQFQKRLKKKMHKSNLQTLFNIKEIPESTQLREIIDNVDSNSMSPIFDNYTSYLQRGKYLAKYELLNNLYYIPMDGTEYFSSYKCFCNKCLRTKHKKKTKDKENDDYELVDDTTEGVRYSHKAVQIAIVHPDMRQVIPLMPEEICNTDGKNKQDCEMNAAKRLVSKLRASHPRLGIILGGDDLYSRQPIIEDILAAKMHYIFISKPESHKYLFEWLSDCQTLNTYETIMQNKKNKQSTRTVYNWMNKVPLYGGKDSILVNYFDIKVYIFDKNGKEYIAYQNSWVTDLEVTKENVETLARGARCKWKVENECFNTLKNQGYCIDHSYGHGNKNLSFNFYLLTLIAFAFHQVHELTEKLYQECRQHFGSKKHLWENIRANLRMFIFDSWDYLFNFTLNPENYITGNSLAPPYPDT